MQDPPTATELLEVAADFLEAEILPKHSGREAFHIRVAINLCRMIAREAHLEISLLEQEEEMLRLFLQRPAEPSSCRELRTRVRDLNAELASLIRRGAIDFRQPELIDLVQESVRRKLLIARPDYIKRV